MNADPSHDRRERRAGVARAVLTLALIALGLWLVSGFLPALVWAVVIAVAVDPLVNRVERRWSGRPPRNLIAFGFTLAIALLVIVPIAVGITQAAREAHDVAMWIAIARRDGLPPPEWIRHLPFGSAEVTNWWRANLSDPQAATEQFHHLSNTAWMAHTRLIGAGLLRRAIIFAFTLVTLFFLIRDRDPIVAQCRVASDRLLGAAGERIGRQAVLSVRGTIDGLVLVGIGEGAVMAGVYLVFGVPHPLLLGALTAVAAMIPFGAALLFGIAALLLIGESAAGAAIAVFVIGLVVVGIADHFLRPALIGNATRLPFLWVLVGILGGVETLGLLGLFVGPATMAVLVMLWREFVGGAQPGAAGISG